MVNVGSVGQPRDGDGELVMSFTTLGPWNIDASNMM